MKKQILIITFTLIVSNIYAQEQGIFRLNGGLAYGTKLGVDKTTLENKGAFGFNIGAEYLIYDKIGVAISYSQFSKQKYSSSSFQGMTIETKSWGSTIDFDLRYYFLSENILAYGLIGYSNLRATAETSLFGSGTKLTATENGINLGVGTIIPISDKAGVNIQGKWQKWPDEDQFVFNTGITFQVN
ncbi:outer membrane beta-barrel protein [Reichenbachiella sp.]|uniref:outer membrane beta-barrel protein n=1 Tax=Reichenbachiella sp. TaxID=2184521 RepID=UPI003BAF4BFC